MRELWSRTFPSTYLLALVSGSGLLTAGASSSDLFVQEVALLLPLQSTEMRLLHFRLLLLLLPDLVTPARILAAFPHLGKSHFIYFEPLLKALATRGHDVVVISPFPQKTAIARYTDINVEKALPMAYVNSLPFGDYGNEDPIATLPFLMSLANYTCEQVLSHHEVQKLMQSKERFDLVMYETFNTDCFLGFAHKFQAPTIAMFSSTLMPWTNQRFGNPDNPSYIPNHFLYHGSKMSFLQRLRNTIYYVATKLYYKVSSEFLSNKIAKRYFGEDLPPLSDLAANTSLLLLNTHFSFLQARPFVPNIVEVAGLHVQPPRKLPQDIEKFLSGAKQGVIYFSLGSTLRASTMPKHILEAFLTAFSKLPQKVLWKWEDDTMTGKPANVMISKWVPQVSVLAHPNVKVFINHGGLMGTIEAVHHGVPMVSIPMFGDQYHNVALCVEKGIALKLSVPEISGENVFQVLKEILDNPQYQENAKRVSRIYHDRPNSALDTAVYWTEYVIKHQGAPHLRSAAIDLNWFQYLLLDVTSVILAAVVIVLYIALLVTKSILRLCKRREVTPLESKKSKKKKKSH